jgi:hypothetical protein
VTLGDGKDMELQVTKQDYESISNGDTVMVAKSKGLLGITIAEVVDY